MRRLGLMLLGLIGCGENAPEAPECPSAVINARFEAPRLEPGATSVSIRLLFDAPVNGVEADRTVVAEAATVAEVTGQGAEYTVRLTELRVQTPFALEARPQGGGATIRSASCATNVLAAVARYESEGPLPAWRAAAPVEWAPPPARVNEVPFVERTDAGLAELVVDAGRAMVVDFDNDGREDIVTLPVTNTPLAPRFLRNASSRAGLRFEDITEQSGMADVAMALLVFADVDNDGDMDAFAGLSFRAADGQGGFWENDGRGRFSHRGLAGTDGPELGRGFFTEAAAATLADFDGDGFHDLYVGHWYGGSSNGNVVPSPDVLYKGDGRFGFTKVALPDQSNPLTAESDRLLVGVSRAAYGISAADYDNDGDVDIFVNNYGAGRPAAGSPPRYWDHNILWRNDGNMTFVDTGTVAGVAASRRGIGGVEDERPLVFGGREWPGPIGGNGFGCQFADFDNDGDLDLIVGTIAHPDYPQSDRTLLHVNQGPPNFLFTEESAARGLEYYEDELHPVMVDVDNDGHLDLAMSRLRAGSKWRLYFQASGARFELQPVESTGVDIARPGPTLWLDVDGDGDLDFFMAQGGGRLFENRSAAGRSFLKLTLVGRGLRDATGARVTLQSSAGTQTRVVASGEGHYNTQQSRVLHFGLGGDSGARTVRIRWPDGEVQELSEVRANIHLRVTQGGAIDVISDPM